MFYFWMSVQKEEILYCVFNSGPTFEGECWSQRVELSWCLVGVHAVAQRQLGSTTAVLPAEVVRDGIIILRCVCEGLRRNDKHFDEIKLHKCMNKLEMK